MQARPILALWLKWDKRLNIDGFRTDRPENRAFAGGFVRDGG
jgi:hypothetical protein